MWSILEKPWQDAKILYIVFLNTSLPVFFDRLSF